MSIFKKKHGITLISLVITIIVMLILAGVSISMIFGENGLLSASVEAKEESKIAEEKENIILAWNTAKTYSLGQDITAEDLNEALKGKATVEVINNKIIVTYDETGNKYYIDEDGNIIKIEGDTIDIEMQDADVTFEVSPIGWINEDVTVTAKINNEEIASNSEYKMQITETPDVTTSWKDGNSQVFEQNGELYVRIVDGFGRETNTYAQQAVVSIDKVLPIIDSDLTSSNLSTDDGFELSVTVTDSNSGLSKIIWYYKKDGDDKYTSIEEIFKEQNSEQAGETVQVTKTKVIEGQTTGVYSVYAEIYDVAGNIVTTKTISQTIEHSYGEWTTTKAATCTEEGSKQRECNTCSGIETEAIAALGHNYSTTYTVDTAATCTSAGSKSQHCTRCSAKTNITTIAQLSHTYGTKTVNSTYLKSSATCKSAAIYYYKCNSCTAKGTNTYTYGSVGTHSYNSNAQCTVCSALMPATNFTLTADNVNMLGIRLEDTVILPDYFVYNGIRYKLTTIGYVGISLRNVREISIPKSVTEIQASAFAGCTNLRTVTFYGVMGATPDITKIGERAFYGCSSLDLIHIPDSVTEIGRDAFVGVRVLIYSGSASGAPWGALEQREK